MSSLGDAVTVPLIDDDRAGMGDQLEVSAPVTTRSTPSPGHTLACVSLIWRDGDGFTVM